jgi:hypothetical protein
MSPYDQQLLKTLASWSESNIRNNFEIILDQGIRVILSILPPLLDDKTKAAIIIQSNYRSHRFRNAVLLGIGKRQAMVTKSVSTMGLLMHAQYPLLLTLRTDLIGSVKGLIVNNCSTNTQHTLKLGMPFMPALQLGQPRVMKVTMALKKSEDYDTSTAISTEHTINIRFTDIETCEYLERDVILRSTKSSKTTDDSVTTNDKSIRLPITRDTVLTLQLINDDSAVSTNIINIEVSRGGYQLSNHFYLFRCYQTISATTIAITQVASDKKVVCTIATREHIDRSTKAMRYIMKLLSCIIEQHPMVSSYLLNRDLGNADHDRISSRYEILLHTGNSRSIRLITSVSADNGNGCLNVNISTAEKRTIIGSCTEIVTTTITTTTTTTS